MDLTPLPQSFFARPTLKVTRDCIGRFLVRELPEGLCVARIVEAEAYGGPHDRAAHSYGGRRTARTEVMFGPAGRVYMFLVYGMHWQLNLVTGREGEAEVVLIRALEPVVGAEWMAARRNRKEISRELCNGPGKLCQALALDRAHYGLDLSLGRELWLAEGKRARARRTPRIGIGYAGPSVELPWRFYATDSAWVSRGPR